MEQIQTQKVNSFVIVLKGECSLIGRLEKRTLIICKELSKDTEAVLEVHREFEDTYRQIGVTLPDELIILLTNENVLEIYCHDKIEPKEQMFQCDGFTFGMEIKINGKGKRYEFEGCNAEAYPLTEQLTKFYESITEGDHE